MKAAENPPTKSTTWIIRFIRWLKGLVPKKASGLPESRQSKLAESDRFARSLIDDIAREVAKKLNILESELSRALWNCREGKPTGDVLTAPLRVECTLTKVAANRIGVCVQMLCHQDERAVITSLKLEFSWDELPREIRSEFIRTGQPELHYVLCELAQTNQTETNI